MRLNAAIETLSGKLIATIPPNSIEIVVYMIIMD
jgi:hypothetical protein